MKQYEVLAAFWRKGNLVPVGSEINLADVEAKYLRHILKEVRPEAEPVLFDAVAEYAPAEADADDLTVALDEPKADKRKRRKD